MKWSLKIFSKVYLAKTLRARPLKQLALIKWSLTISNWVYLRKIDIK